MRAVNSHRAGNLKLCNPDQEGISKRRHCQIAVNKCQRTLGSAVGPNVHKLPRTSQFTDRSRLSKLSARLKGSARERSMSFTPAPAGTRGTRMHPFVGNSEPCRFACCRNAAPTANRSYS
jgi:hypothetical protein